MWWSGVSRLNEPRAIQKNKLLICIGVADNVLQKNLSDKTNINQ